MEGSFEAKLISTFGIMAIVGLIGLLFYGGWKKIRGGRTCKNLC